MADRIKERPILMSGPMVRAIFADLKWNTRRVVKNLPPGIEDWMLPLVRPDGKGGCEVSWPRRDGSMIIGPRCPYGAPGDRLWVRETFCRCETAVCYRAGDGDHENCGGFERWKPSIHMPRSASRLLLEVKDVRVERLQAITRRDIVAEGIVPAPGDSVHQTRRDFRLLWDSINAKRGFSWADNPWCWVIEFKRISP